MRLPIGYEFSGSLGTSCINVKELNSHYLLLRPGFERPDITHKDGCHCLECNPIKQLPSIYDVMYIHGQDAHHLDTQSSLNLVLLLFLVGHWFAQTKGSAQLARVVV